MGERRMDLAIYLLKMAGVVILLTISSVLIPLAIAALIFVLAATIDFAKWFWGRYFRRCV
jgi:hypothetical protein